jgi:septal ring factor EnvC (AmiA/AmiB activator)
MRSFNWAAKSIRAKILPQAGQKFVNLLNFVLGTSPALSMSMFDHLDELEDIQAEVRRVITMLRENEEELRAEGFDVEASIAEIQDQFAQTVRTYCEADRAQDEYLHACADLADAETDYFQSLCELMDPLAKEHPKHPMAKQWNQLRPLLSGQTPVNN